MKILTILGLLIGLSVEAFPAALLIIQCEGEDEPRVWQFFDMQEAREFIRPECPDCVEIMTIQKVHIRGMGGS